MKEISLKNLCNMNSGGTPSRRNSAYYKGSIPWAKISDLEATNDGFIHSTEEHITQDALKSINNRFFDKDTLFLALYGSVGKTAISKIPMSTNQAILGISIKEPSLLDLNYLNYWFKKTKQDLVGKAVGVALKNISKGLVQELKIPLPPLAVQKRITEILDFADAYRQKTKALIEKYDELAQNIFLEMFGDTWLNPKKHPLLRLGSLVRKDKIITYGIVQAGEHVEDGVPYIRTGDIKNGKIESGDLRRTTQMIAESYKRSRCEAGDIIMSIRATVGTVAFLPDELDGANLTQGTARISVDKDICNPTFLYHSINSRGIQLKIDQQAKGATFREITLTRLREIEIPIPPKHLQNKFADMVTSIDYQRQKTLIIAKESDNLFNSLLQKAFKGELINDKDFEPIKELSSHA